MTIESDLQKALAQAEQLRGSYAVFATSTQDPDAKKMFQAFHQDMQRHVDTLYGHINYVSNN